MFNSSLQVFLSDLKPISKMDYDESIINKSDKQQVLIMKRIVMSILAITFPWIVLLIKDNPGGAVVALILQASFIGWPFASVWAWKTVHPSNTVPKAEIKE